MIEGSLARRYTRALFQLARETGQEEKIGQEIEQLYAVFSGSELQGALTNPAFPMDSRKRILIQVANGLQLSVLSIHFLSLLLERDRLLHLPGIVNCYRRLLNEAKGRVEAKVVSAAGLEATMVERLREQLKGISGKEVVLQQETDPTLLGGLLVELEGKVYDGSVRTQLEKMKQRIAREY
ncbi:MAG: ATP synthase F1 subunit delta [Deltaproteobacteria bacterium]|nr:ATP synthase F1 subunit delta [Deltaproteobacteria bacterium]MBI2181773.1 ATP synthase F1 subunit delta [Deltaproteobacteria bacterium]MBI2232018.1 ATP synthase F1 subunit delta [Deltaproteobacteria bacterium]MBI2367151.1 ATP synthase F1 subunit delta [Deltaproteobacteria bacterium]